MAFKIHRGYADLTPCDRLRAVFCYPRPILGNSPEWYRTPNYRRRIVRWPRQVLSEFGLQLPDGVEVRVEDLNQKHRFMVMPLRPAGTEGWTEDRLAGYLTRDCLHRRRPAKTRRDKQCYAFNS